MCPRAAAAAAPPREGVYAVQLRDVRYERQAASENSVDKRLLGAPYVVAIDCEARTLHDPWRPADAPPLPLTQASLDLCLGEVHSCVGFVSARKIERRP